MCILFAAIQQHPDYPLIIAANRDEYFDRPTQYAHFWEDQPGLLAGKDLQAGGTWLGVKENGQFAAVTNIRQPVRRANQINSRGQIPVDYLCTFNDQQEFKTHLLETHTTYQPFNVISGTPQSLSIFSSQLPQFKQLKKGIHSLSNGSPEDKWEKMSRGENLLEQYLNDTLSVEIDGLLEIMQYRDPSNTDVSSNTSIFEFGEKYGTRATTFVLYSLTQLQFIEYNYTSDGLMNHTQQYATPLSAFEYNLSKQNAEVDS